MKSKVLDNLYIGDDSDACEFEFQNSEGPVMTIDLRGWNLDEDIRNGDMYRVKQTLEIIYLLMTLEVPTLVYCHGGIDRSPFIVACYLTKWYSPNAAYAFVKEDHPQTIIHDDWMRKFIVVTKPQEESK